MTESLYVPGVLIGVVIVIFLWLYSKSKQIYKKLNKRNTRIPDMNIVKKVAHFTPKVGWTVDGVYNGLPIWKYSTTFTFSPYNLYGVRTHLPFKSSKVLEELVNVKTFTSIFPGLPSLKLEQRANKDSNKDHLSLSNLYSHLSMTSILRGSKIPFLLDRVWYSEPLQSWLYMSPSNTKLAENFGYWICFHLQDLPTDKHDGCLLHVLASFPKSTGVLKIKSTISSCALLTEDHMKFLNQESLNNLQNSEPTVVITKEEIKDEQKKEIQKSRKSIVLKCAPDSVDNSSKKCANRKEDYGKIEEPAIIQRIASNSSDASLHSLSSYNIKKESIEAQNKDESISKNEESFQSNVYRHESDCSDYVQDPRLEQYSKIISDGFDGLMEAYNADESCLGWTKIGFKDDVHMYCREADETSSALMFKGTTIVNVPFHYLFNYIHDISNKREHDSLFDKGEDIVVYNDGLTKVQNLLFYPIWPVAARDLCNLTVDRHLKENVYAILAKGIEHPDCPPKSSKIVRAEVILAGYIFKVLNKDGTKVELTYCSRAEFKGSVPQRIVNKVNAEQPKMVGSIRNHVEKRYKNNDPPRDSGLHLLDMFSKVPSVYEKPIPSSTPLKEDVAANENTEIDKDIKTESIKSVNVAAHEKDGDADLSENSDGNLDNCSFNEKREGLVENKSSSEISKDSNISNTNGYVGKSFNATNPNGLMVREDYFNGSRDSIGNESLLNDEDFEISMEGSDIENADSQSVNVSDQEFDLPRDIHGKTDYVTLGNQAAALLEEQFILVGKKISEFSTLSQESLKAKSNVRDEWIYHGHLKDVIIMKMNHSKKKINSFSGQGIINVLPITIFEALKNPHTRFVYDNMLKKTQVLKEISDKVRIIYMHHETNGCFLKQARESVVMHVERINDKRYFLAGVSVDLPECPPNKALARLKVLNGGWIIEPIMRNNRQCSLVTYICQVDFGGHIPARLNNLIARRQPLAVAYLRQYLESNEL